MAKGIHRPMPHNMHGAMTKVDPNKPPLARPKARSIPPAIRLQLVAAAAGRCEFPGCGEYLFENAVTLSSANFSEDAHIWAFSEDGPRGRAPGRPSAIHSIGNLMLLCPRCHKEIDTHHHKYPVEQLKKFKTEHEERMRHLTGLALSARTVPIVLTATIDGKAAHAPLSQVICAIAPMWPHRDARAAIDFTAFSQESEEFFRLVKADIRAKLQPLLARDLAGAMPDHFSVFAIGPIPALMELGTALSNTLHVGFFQRHRDGDGTWAWQDSNTPLLFRARKLRDGTDPTKVALSLAVSGDPDVTGLPAEIDASYSVYEVGLVDMRPTFNLLKTRADLERFRAVYRDLMTALVHDHAGLTEVHVFPAVPPAVAVTCGYDLNPKLHPTLLVYDYHRANGGYTPKARINEHHD